GSVEIDRPTDEVFAWIREPDKLTQWVGWLAEVQNDPTTPKEGIGHRETWVMDDPRMKTRISVPGTITLWDPPGQMGVHVEMPRAAGGAASTSPTAPGAGRPRLEGAAPFRSLPRLATLLEPVTTPDAMHKMYDDMQRLKRKLEAQPFPSDSTAADSSAGAAR